MAIKKVDSGFYQCTECGEIESEEREVICWVCGDGEMVWRSYPALVVVNDEESSSLPG